MGLRCSLHGHKWGDKHVETETRDEDDGQVTVKKTVRTCDRCDEADTIKQRTVAKSELNPSQSDIQTDSASSTPASSSLAADGGSAFTGGDPRDGDDHEEAAIILGDDDESTDGSEPERSDEPPTPQTEESSMGDIHVPSHDDPEDGLGDVGPEGGSTQEETTQHEPTYSDDIIPESESQNVELIGGASDTAREPEGVDETATQDSDVQSHESDVLDGTGITVTDSDSDSQVNWQDEATHTSQTLVSCPVCSYEEPVDNTSVYPGDACPECRGDFLEEK